MQIDWLRLDAHSRISKLDIAIGEHELDRHAIGGRGGDVPQRLVVAVLPGPEED